MTSFILVSFPAPLPAAILFSPARIKWRPEVGLGTRLHLYTFASTSVRIDLQRSVKRKWWSFVDRRAYNVL